MRALFALSAPVQPEGTDRPIWNVCAVLQRSSLLRIDTVYLVVRPARPEDTPVSRTVGSRRAQLVAVSAIR